MPRRSAGILLYRTGPNGREVLLAHPGGPFWARRDDGAWSIIKGEYEHGVEDPLAAAQRELAEELGAEVELGELTDLGEVRQAGGKIVRAWAAEGAFDTAELRSNTFTMEWPARSGQRQEFPEVDRVAWFSPDHARHKLVAAQREAVDRLLAAGSVSSR